MSTTIENINYLTDAARYPKQTSKAVTLPKYQISSDEYNRLVELVQSYKTNVDAVSSLASDIDNFELRLTSIEDNYEYSHRHRLVMFGGIDESIMQVLQTSSTTNAVGPEIKWSSTLSAFVLPDAFTNKVYINWANADLWRDGEGDTYADTLYVDVANLKMYVFVDGEMTLVSGGGNDEPYVLSFETNTEDGCVYFEEQGIDVGGTFEIDANGCMIYDFTTTN